MYVGGNEIELKERERWCKNKRQALPKVLPCFMSKVVAQKPLETAHKLWLLPSLLLLCSALA